MPFKEADTEKSKKEKKITSICELEIIRRLIICFLTLEQRSSCSICWKWSRDRCTYVFNPLLEAFNALKDKLAVVYVPVQEKEKTYVEIMPYECFKLPENSQALADFQSIMKIEDRRP